MKFWIGFILGAGAAGLVLSQLDERQRERLARSAVQAARTGRSGDIATSVSDGVGGIADVATDRVHHRRGHGDDARGGIDRTP